MDDSGNFQKNISIGQKVGITTRSNRTKIIEGLVKKILTRSDFHPYGIMVELDDGSIGRIKSIESIVNENSTVSNIPNYPEIEVVQQDVIDSDPLSFNRIPTSCSISINEDDTGYSYSNLFYPYLKDSHIIVIRDSYIRMEYQIKNFATFCSILYEIPKPLEVKLITGTDDQYKKSEQARKLNELKEHLKMSNIDFHFEFDEVQHDRSITTDTGWKIVPGRGLDIFKDPGSYYAPENFDQSKRKCKKTEIHYIKN